MRYFVFLTCVLVLNSCTNDSDDDLTKYVMNDGTTFYTDGNVHIYNDVETFLGIERPKGSSEPVYEHMEYERDSIYGYDEATTTKWEKAELGSWAEKFGLTTGHPYYISTIQVKRILPPIDSDRLVRGVLYSQANRDSIGCREGSKSWGIRVNYRYGYNVFEAYTVIKRIEYDEDGMAVGIYIPTNPNNLKWIFEVSKDIITW